MTALSLLRRDGPLATCNSPPPPRRFLPLPAAWLNGTFEGSKSAKLCLITSPGPDGVTGVRCVYGLGGLGRVCVAGRGLTGVKRDLSCVCAGGALICSSKRTIFSARCSQSN